MFESVKDWFKNQPGETLTMKILKGRQPSAETPVAINGDLWPPQRHIALNIRERRTLTSDSLTDKYRWFHVVLPLPPRGEFVEQHSNLLYGLSTQILYIAESIVDLDEAKYIKCRHLSPAEELDVEWVEMLREWPPIIELDELYDEVTRITGQPIRRPGDYGIITI